MKLLISALLFTTTFAFANMEDKTKDQAQGKTLSSKGKIILLDKENKANDNEANLTFDKANKKTTLTFAGKTHNVIKLWKKQHNNLTTVIMVYEVEKGKTYNVLKGTYMQAKNYRTYAGDVFQVTNPDAVGVIGTHTVMQPYTGAPTAANHHHDKEGECCGKCEGDKDHDHGKDSKECCGKCEVEKDKKEGDCGCDIKEGDCGCKDKKSKCNKGCKGKHGKHGKHGKKDAMMKWIKTAKHLGIFFFEKEIKK